MIINGLSLLKMAPIKNMHKDKMKSHGVSFGLGEAGYDIRIKQEIRFRAGYCNERTVVRLEPEFVHLIDGCDELAKRIRYGRFALASAIEEFQMPSNLVGVVHDKSTWARKGLSVFNTVIEPGWKGFLTLELVFHGYGELTIPAGAGIAQVLFHQTILPAQYEGKYQDQADKPVQAKES